MTKQQASTPKKAKNRFLLDNSSRWYPMYATKKVQSLFCIGVKLQDEVDVAVLREALNDVIVRFPAYKVTMKAGYSWHYLEEIDTPIDVYEYDGSVLEPIKPKETNGYWFKVYYQKNTILLKMFHGLCDGFGAMGFFKCLLARYCALKGVEVDKSGLIDWQEEPTQEELEDGFERYYKKIPLSQMDLKGMAGGEPYRFDDFKKTDKFVSTNVYASCKDVLQKAKEMGATFTSYIAGVLAYTIEQVCHNSKPSVIMIPVNLRSFFPTKSMRNFVTFVRVVIPPNKFESVEEYIKEAQRQVKQKVVKDNLESIISTTTKAQNNPVLKAVPIFLKSLFLRLGRVFMRSRQTMIFTNLGPLNMPKEFGVKDFVFHMNTSKNNPINLGVFTQEDTVTFAFTRAVEEDLLQDGFVKNLEKMGVTMLTKSTL